MLKIGIRGIILRIKAMNSIYLYLSAILLSGLCSCASSRVAHSVPEDPLMAKANELAQKYLITDGHVDLPYRLKISNFQLTREYMGIPIETDAGDFDYVRAKKGGLDAPFMSIFLPANLQEERGKSKALADELIDMVEGIAREHPDKFGVAKSVADCERFFAEGKIALPMGMENGSGIEDDITNVRYFKDRGISYITLTHGKVNLICDSSYDPLKKWNGLSPFGEDVVREMIRVGIMIDISHVSDETFYDVMAMSTVPVIASHSSCRVFTPDFERNMSDDMIKRLAQNGGVIQINFGSSFLDKEVADGMNRSREELTKILADQGLSYRDPEAKEVIEAYRKSNPVLLSDVKKVADHIDHVVKIAGIDYVGLGSDFDGVGDTLPTGLKDVSQFPNLIYELLKRGYTDEDIEKICSGNVFRVWRAVEAYAQRS